MRWAVLWVLLIGVVLVPFFLFEDQFNALAAYITGGGVSRSLAAAAILALLALDVFLPVPSSLVATAAGVLLGFVGGAAVVWLGMTAGCVLAYVLGRRASAGAAWIVGGESLTRAEELVRRYGDLALVVCRPVPVLAEASVVFAGVARAPMTRVVLLTALANLGIACGYAAFGAFSMRIDSFVAAFIGALALPALALGLSRLLFRRRGHDSAS
jgi:uncharacterized membrane protein YdjX (TVP38/TMEM64 family)